MHLQCLILPCNLADDDSGVRVGWYSGSIMSSLYQNAQEWAQDHSLANVPRLARLEGFAFQGHPEIVASFGADGAAMVERAQRVKLRSSPVRRGLERGMIVGAIIGIASPVVGVAMYAAGRSFFAAAEPLAPEISIPGAGLSFTVAALTQLLLWMYWLRQRAMWDPVILGVAVIAAVMAAFAAIGVPNVSGQAGMDSDGWMTPIWVTMALGAALALAIAVRHRVKPAEPADAAPSAPTLSDREQARMLVRELPAAARDEIQYDRDEALRTLAERGLLDDDELQRTLRADLGTLFTLDPLRAD